MKRNLLFLCILAVALALTACEKRSYLTTCSAMRDDINTYTPYLSDVYKEYNHSYEDEDEWPSMLFVTEKGDTVALGVWAGYGEFPYLDDMDMPDGQKNAPDGLIGGATMSIMLKNEDVFIAILFYWIADYEMKTFNRMELVSIDKNTDNGIMAQEGDLLTITQPNGDSCTLQYGIGIKQISCHDGRTWTPVVAE